MVELRYDLVDFLRKFVEILSAFTQEPLKLGEIFSWRNLLTYFFLGGVVLLKIF